jgi:hypothetical protein
MADMTLYLGNRMLRWMAGHAMPSPPLYCLVGLYNGNPKTSGVEVTNLINFYGMIPIMFDAIAEGTDNIITNAVAIDFGASDNPTTVTHAAVFDDSGNMLFSDVVPGQPLEVVAGQLVFFDAGQLVFTAGSAS